MLKGQIDGCVNKKRIRKPLHFYSKRLFLIGNKFKYNIPSYSWRMSKSFNKGEKIKTESKLICLIWIQWLYKTNPLT